MLILAREGTSESESERERERERESCVPIECIEAFLTEQFILTHVKIVIHHNVVCVLRLQTKKRHETSNGCLASEPLTLCSLKIAMKVYYKLGIIVN